MKYLGIATVAWFAYWIGYCVGVEVSERGTPIEPVQSVVSSPEWWRSKALHPTGISSQSN